MLLELSIIQYAILSSTNTKSFYPVTSDNYSLLWDKRLFGFANKRYQNKRRVLLAQKKDDLFILPLCDRE